MVLGSSLVVWGSLLTSSLLLHELVKPKFPNYKLKILSYPSLSGKVRNAIELYNSNFLPIEVHGLNFDLYYPDSTGILQHIGYMQDRNQYYRNMSMPSLWIIEPRKIFKVEDDMYWTTETRIWSLLWRILYGIWVGNGSIVVSSSGVAHIRAHGNRFTVGSICDNYMNTWKMEIEGIDCVLYKLQTGWRNVEDSVGDVRNYTVSHYRATDLTSGVLSTKRSWAESILNLAYEEALQSV